MKKLFVLFNHTLTPAQREDARCSLGVTEILHPPPEVRSLWSALPPDSSALQDLLAPVLLWLNSGRKGDFVLVQGDLGACYLCVQYSFLLGMSPIYSTTKRRAVEEYIGENEVRLDHLFEHVAFRRYEKLTREGA